MLEPSVPSEPTGLCEHVVPVAFNTYPAGHEYDGVAGVDTVVVIEQAEPVKAYPPGHAYPGTAFLSNTKTICLDEHELPKNRVSPRGQEYVITEDVLTVTPEVHVWPDRVAPEGHAYVTDGARVPAVILVVAHADALGALTLSGLTEAETE